MYYGTESGSGTNYDVEGIDLIETSEYILDGLEAETEYFIAVTSVDSFGVESDYSQELRYQTAGKGSQAQATSFRIEDVEVIDSSALEFIFSQNIEADAQREFILEERLSGEEVFIELTQVDENNPESVIVLLAEDLEVGVEYRVTVLDITNTSGNTIES